jgi:hypothetical protein
MPALGGEVTDAESFDRLVAAALASLLSLSHLPGLAPSAHEFADDESVEQAYARASLVRAARADVLEQLRAEAVEVDRASVARGPGGKEVSG